MATISQNLRRLRRAADAVAAGFPQTEWTKITGPGPATLSLAGNGTFKDLDFEPQGHSELVLRCTLTLPAEVAVTPLAGQPLEATLNSLHPVDVSHNGRNLFSDSGIPVAAGPALFTVIPQLQEGDNGTIELRVRFAKYHMVPWMGIKFTTPNLRMRFEQLDLAWAQLALADALTDSPSERSAVQAAAEMAPELIEARPDSLPPLLNRFAATLSPLQKKVAGISVILIGHSHIDMNWLWTWDDTLQVIRRDFRSVLSLMDDYPELTFSHSQPATYEAVRRHEPELFSRVLEFIKTGRWEATTMQWVEADSNMPGGEAHVRQFLQAILYSRKTLGITPNILHAPDTFGHAGNLPQLANSAGAIGYYHHRANPGQANLWPAYWWEGQDGSRLLAFSTPVYNGEINASDLASAAIRAHQAGHAFGLHFHGIGDHGGGPARQNLDALRRLQKIPGLPTAFCGTMAEYARAIVNSNAQLPIYRGESSTIFEGCYTTHADIKRHNRQAENLLTTADTLAVMAGLNQNKQLTNAWQKVLFNQFHDILDGSAINNIYDDSARDFQTARTMADEAINASLDVLERGIPQGCIAVTNQLAFERSDIVTIKELQGNGSVELAGDHGHITPGQYTSDGLIFVAKVPPLSTASYRISGKSKSPAHDITAIPRFAPNDPRSENPPPDPVEMPFLEIETPYFVANVRPDNGIIVSLIDKRVGREIVGFGRRRATDYQDFARPELCLNVLQIFDELPHKMSSWQMLEVHREQSLLTGAITKVVETGPVRCVLEVKHAIRSSTITQQIIFYRDLPRIDFDTRVDWREIGSATAGVPGMKASFTAHLEDPQAWFETPFAAVKRIADGLEVPALRWADVGEPNYGIALLNDSKYGHDVLGCRLRLTLLRSGYDPDPISDAGEHHIRYGLLPHSGDWRDAGVVQAGMSFNQPLLARIVSNPSSQKAATIRHPRIITTAGVQVACLKISEDAKGPIFRLYESTGRNGSAKITGLNPFECAYETNIIEDRLHPFEQKDGTVELTFSPWQIRTVLVGKS